jgi:hypothetical protein
VLNPSTVVVLNPSTVVVLNPSTVVVLNRGAATCTIGAAAQNRELVSAVQMRFECNTIVEVNIDAVPSFPGAST